MSDFEDKRFSAFMTLTSFRQNRMKDRTQHEWRVALALWGFLVAATYYSPFRPPEYFILGSLFVVIFIHGWFVLEVRKRNRHDVEMSFYYADHAESLLLQNITIRPRPPHPPALRLKQLWEDKWYSLLQILITAALCFLMYSFIGKLSNSPASTAAATTLVGLAPDRSGEYRISFAALYNELKGWQQGIGALLGVLALMAAALFNFRLNRRRDTALREEEARSILAALYGEILLLRSEVALLAYILAKQHVPFGQSGLKIDEHFLRLAKSLKQRYSIHWPTRLGFCALT